MTTTKFLLPAIALSLIAVPAFADDEEDETQEETMHRRERERLDREFKELAEGVPVQTAEAGLDTIAVQAPPWCKGKPEDVTNVSASGMRRTFESATRYSNYWGAYFDVARQTCRYPKIPAVQQTVQAVLQRWVNLTGLSRADAVETFTIRLDKDKFDADKKALCDQLTVSDEIEGGEKFFMKTRRALFCRDYPLWAEYSLAGTDLPDELVGALDAATTAGAEIDELVRLALVLNKSTLVHREQDSYFENALLAYIVDQFDYRAFSPDKALAAIDVAPYKGNSYARAMIKESVARARMQIKALDALIAKKAKDDGWKELLVTAPARGAAAFLKAADPWKAELVRSHQFEEKFWGPSRKALKGCWKELRADFMKVFKTLKFESPDEIKGTLSDPIASLLLSRLAVCAAVDTERFYAAWLLALSADLPLIRGPRTAAQFEAAAALGAILEDRTKFPVKHNDVRTYSRNALYDAGLGANNDNKINMAGDDPMGFVGDNNTAVVKSIKKSGDRVDIEFVRESHKVAEETCVETNKFAGWDTAGRPYYRMKCKPTGKMLTIDTTPDPIFMPAEWATGIKKGALVDFDAARGRGQARMGLPKAVWTEKSKKKLVNWYGLAL
jgi:hypothetical protein